MISAWVWKDTPPPAEWQYGKAPWQFENTTGPWVFLNTQYESEDHAREWRDHLLDFNDATSNHILYPHTKNKPEWYNDLPDWLGFLSQELLVPVEALDFSLESCKRLDAQRRKLRVSGKRYAKAFFAPGLGYLYEVIRRYWGGAWELRPAADAPILYEPFIRMPSGVLFEIFDMYWEAVHEDYRHFSLYEMAQGATTGASRGDRAAFLGT